MGLIKSKVKAIFHPIIKMKSVSRISLEATLHELFKRLESGVVLDVGSKSSPYKNRVPHTKWITLDIDPSKGVDIVADIHDIPCKSGYFDTIIATEVLEHCYCPEKVVAEIHKLLKRGGICIASTRFIHPYHPSPHDYYRFTQDGLEYLFRKFDFVEILHHGNTLQSVWMLINRHYISALFNIFNPIIGRIKSRKTACPCGFVVVARK